MISGFTWPNYNCSDKDATRALIDENNFSDDVKYGKTKLFIRSPQTLFSLEKVCKNCFLKLKYMTLVMTFF